MKRLFISQFAIGVISVLVWSLLGAVPASQATNTVNFISTDEPGPWFKCVGAGCVPAGTDSLAIVPPDTEVRITNGTQTNSVHTFTSLLWPTGARNMPFDQKAAFNGNRSVKLKDPGLYVFVCKLHPFMLAATIVDDPATVNPNSNPPGGPAFDLGYTIDLINGITKLPTSSDLATRLLRAFFLITNPKNYQDHNPATNPLLKWTIAYPLDVPVVITGGAVVDLKTVLVARYETPPITLDGPTDPALIPPGVGEVWIDTEYEKTSHKTKPGTATAVDASTWKVTKKDALHGSTPYIIPSPLVCNHSVPAN